MNKKRKDKFAQEKKTQLTDKQARWIYSLFFLAYRNLISEGDALLSSLNLGRAQFRVMFILNRRAGYTMGEVRDVLKISNQAITRVLKQLLFEGYVRQELSIDDRRKRFLFLTQKGENALNDVTRVQKKCLDQALKEVGMEQFRSMGDSLLAMLSDADRNWMQTTGEDENPL